MSINKKPDSFPVLLRNMAGPVFLACTFALIAGCATEPPQTTFYSAPDLAPAAQVTIIGTRTISGYIGDQTTYLAAVDGLPIENAKATSANGIKVAPGYRALTIVCAQDSLLATSEITAKLKAGQAYTLRAEKIPLDNAVQKNTQGDELYNIWIEDSLTQEVVDAKHTAKLNAIAANIHNPENNVPYPKIGDAAGELLIRLIGAVLDVVIEGALEPRNTYSTGNAGMKGTQRQSGASPPIKQAPNPPPQSPLPGKLPPRNDAPPPGKLMRQ